MAGIADWVNNTLKNRKNTVSDDQARRFQYGNGNAGGTAGTAGALQTNAGFPTGAIQGVLSLIGNADGMTNAGKKRGSGSGGSYTVNANNQQYVDQVNKLYSQIMNRQPFKYDLNGDMLYRQMADQYTQLGRQAMQDTMGQAAALTGGYGNSYANSVGNQAYQQYLTALNEQVPNLYQQAYNVWQGEGERLMQLYELAAQHPSVVESIAPKTVYYDLDTGKTSYGDLVKNLLQNANGAAVTGTTAAAKPTYGDISASMANPLNAQYYYNLLQLLK